MSRKRVSSIVLVVALAVLGFLVYPHAENYLKWRVMKQQADAQQAIYLQKAEVLKAEAAKEAAGAKKLAHADRQMDDVPAAYPRPRSAWRSSEKAFYRDILAKRRFDVLVVPFQVQDGAFAREFRSLMTAQLVMAIGEAAKLSIADPYLVARALGDGERRFDLAEIFELANAVGARRVVAGYVGHDEKNAMRVTLHVFDRNQNEVFGAPQFGPHPGRFGYRLVASDRLKSEHFENLAYSDETTPIDAFQGLLPGMLKFLDIEAGQPAEKPLSRVDLSHLPASPLALAGDAPEPARDAYSLQLMAALAPRWAERQRERLIEKSMLALLRMSPESPDYRVLKARALMYMGMRAAALRALGTPASAEEKHLFGVLNGNLPEVRANRPAVAGAIRALIALVEESAMAVLYEPDADHRKRFDAAIAARKLPGKLWPYLAHRAAMDLNLWAQYDNIELKALLDRELPIEGFTAEGMLRGAVAIGDMQKVRTEADLSVFEHVRKQIERSPAESCCQLVARATPADLLDLVEGIATDNLSRRARFWVQIQGNPEAASRFLATIESVYKDHPDFVVARARAELALSRSASGAEKESLAKSAYIDAYNAWYWEQGQTRASADAVDEVLQYVRRTDFDYFRNAYVEDYPYRSYYTFLYSGDTERTARAALKNSCFEFWPVEYLAWRFAQFEKRPEKVDELLASIDRRFDGNAGLIKLKAQSSVRRGDRKAAEQYYSEGIRLQPKSKDLYAELGKLLFENGEQARSAKIFMSFPGLRDRSVNRVELSNYAFEAGSLFYWSGDFKNALPLYKVAADLDTGSGASMTSAIRLALLSGDYADAMSGYLVRAQRYSSPHAFRDYLGLLHVLGHSKEAWDGFTTLLRQIDQPQVWETALVGHRIEGKSEADIAAWLGQEPMRSAGRDYAFAPMYMLRAGVTDRMPSAELPARVAALERQVWKIEDNWKHVVRPSVDGRIQYVLGRESPLDGTTLPLGVFDTMGRSKVKSELVYYAEAYRAIRTGKFGEASADLQEAATLYDLRNESLGYLLPAYGYAAARARDTAALEKTLDGFSPQYQRFDYHLAKAALTGIAGKRAESLEHLKLALVRRPYTERRPIYTEYQYAEVCEWLYEATRDVHYRTLALDWAKRYESVAPWFAWPYAMEARLSADPARRGRAIAMAYYLDRKSEQLGMLPKSEVQSAVKEYANRNPFKRALDRTPKQPA